MNNREKKIETGSNVIRPTGNNSWINEDLYIVFSNYLKFVL